MRKKRKDDFEDDGRTIADMSSVSYPPTFLPRRPSRGNAQDGEETETDAPQNTAPPFTKEERRIYIFAALRASLLIAGVFIVGLGLAILIMILVWS